MFRIILNKDRLVQWLLEKGVLVKPQCPCGTEVKLRTRGAGEYGSIKEVWRCAAPCRKEKTLNTGALFKVG